MPKIGDDKGNANVMLPLALTALISAGGTTAVHSTIGNDTIVDTTMHSCEPYIEHGKNHQRIDLAVDSLTKELKERDDRLLRDIKLYILENK